MPASVTRLGSEFRVNSATANDQTAPDITALSNGGFVVTWVDGSLGVGGATGDASSTAVKAQVFGAGGTQVGGEIRVNTATANAQSAPQITALSGGGFVVTWVDASLGVGGGTGDTSSTAVKAQVFAAGGTTVGSEIRVNTATASAQSVPETTALFERRVRRHMARQQSGNGRRVRRHERLGCQGTGLRRHRHHGRQ